MLSGTINSAEWHNCGDRNLFRSYLNPNPSITEIGTLRKELAVNWDLSKNPVPLCKWITINTEFMLPRYNAIFYKDVHFTYPKQIKIRPIPDLKWMIHTPIKEGAVKLPNVTGGYLIGSFDILYPQLPEQRQLIGQYRFIHEYSFDQDSEIHEFSLTGTQGFLIANLRFAHSYGYFSKDELWKFKDWTTLPTLKNFISETSRLNLELIGVENILIQKVKISQVSQDIWKNRRKNKQLLFDSIMYQVSSDIPVMKN